MAGGGGIYNNPTSLIDSLDSGPMSGTENSLWIDQKYKTFSVPLTGLPSGESIKEVGLL